MLHAPAIQPHNPFWASCRHENRLQRYRYRVAAQSKASLKKNVSRLVNTMILHSSPKLSTFFRYLILTSIRIALYDRYDKLIESTKLVQKDMKDDSNTGVRQFVTPTGVLSLNVVLAKTYDSNQDPTLTYVWNGDGDGIETNGLSRETEQCSRTNRIGTTRRRTKTNKTKTFILRILWTDATSGRKKVWFESGHACCRLRTGYVWTQIFGRGRKVTSYR